VYVSLGVCIVTKRDCAAAAGFADCGQRFPKRQTCDARYANETPSKLNKRGSCY
jgi:hypothetical protein